jgi:hypothetical protein
MGRADEAKRIIQRKSLASDPALRALVEGQTVVTPEDSIKALIGITEGLGDAILWLAGQIDEVEAAGRTGEGPVNGT